MLIPVEGHTQKYHKRHSRFKDRYSIIQDVSKAILDLFTMYIILAGAPRHKRNSQERTKNCTLNTDSQHLIDRNQMTSGGFGKREHTYKQTHKILVL